MSRITDHEALVEEYYDLADAFREKAAALPYENVGKYWWYHTVDLGNGLITPGCYDYRPVLPAFAFPDNMQAMTVLDIGSATGYFAFEFERRGAQVTSIEAPSISSFDRFPGETLQDTLRKARAGLASLEEPLPVEDRHDYLFDCSTPEELFEWFYDGPFKFCHRLLESKVCRRYCTIYDLSPVTAGAENFDLVFAGDVLWHTIDPLRALAAAAAMTRRTLIIAQDLQNDLSPHPAMLYIGGDKSGEDSFAWWVPNQRCFEQLLKKFGFETILVVGTHSGFLRPARIPYERTIIHATRPM